MKASLAIGLLCVFFICSVFSEEVVIVPATSGGITLTFNKVSTTTTAALLQGSGGFNSGQTSGVLTYNFGQRIRLTRIQLVTDQDATGSTTHLIETGIQSPNTLAYVFSGTTTTNQVLSLTFASNTVAQIVRINTTLAVGILRWASISIWGDTLQFVPSASSYFQIFSNVPGPDPSPLLAGTGEWNSGFSAGSPYPNVTLTYDFNQVTRVDKIVLVCRQTQTHTTTVSIYGILGSDTPAVFIQTQSAVTSDYFTLIFTLNSGVQYRQYQIVTTFSGLDTVGWRSVLFFSATANPDLQFYPNTYGATTLFYTGAVQTVTLPTGVNTATIVAYGGGGGSSRYVTGRAGGSYSFTGSLPIKSTQYQFIVGGIGRSNYNAQSAGGWGNGVYDGGVGAFKVGTTYPGGGGGGATYITNTTNARILVVGGAGGAGGNYNTTDTTRSYTGGAGGDTGSSAGNGADGYNSIGGQGGCGTALSCIASGGGGGGGGGVAAGGGGREPTIPVSVGSGAGGGAGTSSVQSSSWTAPSWSSSSIGPMPGALQIQYDFQPLLFILDQFSQLSVSQDSPFSTWAYYYASNYEGVNVPVMFTLYGGIATFSGGGTSCTVLTDSTNTATSCQIVLNAPGNLMIYAQSPISSTNGGYIYKTDAITITA